MAHVEGIELEEYTIKLMERFEHLYGGTVTGEFEEGARVDHRMFTLWWDDMQWVEFGVTVPGHNEDGDWYLYTLPVYGDAHFWPRKVLLEQSFSTGRLRFECSEEEYRETLGQEVHYFLSWYLDNISERPRQKYLLEEERNGEYRIVLAPDRHPEAGSKAGGLVDGPGVLPHWGRSWVFSGSIVKGVRLGGHTQVRGSSKVQFAGDNPPDKAVLVRADTITGSRISLQHRSIIETGCLLEWVHLDRVIRIKANSTLAGVTIRSRDKLTSLRMNTFLHNMNLAAGRGASPPFVQVAPIGADNDLLTVWYDSNEKQILAKRGCFKGTIEEFLRSAQARYGDSSTPGGTHIFYTYQNLLPTLVAQVRSLMPGDEK